MRFIVSILAVVVFISAFAILKPSTNNPVVIIEKINGMSVVSGNYDAVVDSFKSIKTQSNANWVAILPYAYSRLNEPAVHYNSKRQWWGETVEGTYSYVSKAQQAGLKIMIKPQIWVPQSWTGGLTYHSDGQWEKWESDYERFILDFAQVADSMNIEMLCIGTELKISATERSQFWNKLIPKIKTVYSGKLTYAANWDNFENITFWDQLDYIGVDAYFPLSEEIEPTVNELLQAWEKPFQAIRDISKKYSKPVLFTEFGYLSIDEAAGKTWELEKDRHERVHNQQAQANAYEALFKKFWNEPWVAGGFAWKWYLGPVRTFDYMKNGYTPQRKIVLETFRKWYTNLH